MEDQTTNKITSLIDYAIDKTELKGQLEALLFAAGDPMSVQEIASALELVPDTVEVLLEEMATDYESPNRGIQVIRLEDKIQLTTKVEYSDTVLKLAEVNERQTLSKGALECLAIIVYKQPVTRVEIDEIRGVSSQYVIGKLLERSFITVIGRKKVPGKPKLYATTDEFLRQFGFDNIKVFTQDETYQDLMNQMSNEALLSDDDILPDYEGDDEDETQLTIWN